MYLYTGNTPSHDIRNDDVNENTTSINIRNVIIFMDSK